MRRRSPSRPALGATDDVTFITGMKTNHAFAIEYTARLLRITIRHHGPILHGHIHGELSNAAVNEFRSHLEIMGDFPTPPRGLACG